MYGHVGGGISVGAGFSRLSDDRCPRLRPAEAGPYERSSGGESLRGRLQPAPGTIAVPGSGG